MSLARLNAKKPGRWACRQAQVAPEWRWVWKSLGIFVPFWEGGGYPRDIVGGQIDAGGRTPLWVPSPAGLSLDYTGGTTSYYAAFTDRPWLRFPGSWTIAALVVTGFQTSDSTTSGWSIFSKGGATEGAGDNHNWLLTYNKNTFNDDQAGNGWTILFERADSAGANVSAKYVVDVAVGEQHLVMAVLDAAKGELRVYIDGILRRTRSTSFVAETNATPVAVGKFGQFSDSSSQWKGKIPGVWGWSRAFSDAEAEIFSKAPFAAFSPYRLRVASAPAPTSRSFAVVIG